MQCMFTLQVSRFCLLAEQHSQSALRLVHHSTNICSNILWISLQDIIAVTDPRGGGLRVPPPPTLKSYIRPCIVGPRRQNSLWFMHVDIVKVTLMDCRLTVVCNDCRLINNPHQPSYSTGCSILQTKLNALCFVSKRLLDLV